MRTIRYQEISVAVFSPEVRRAIARAALVDPWTDLGQEGEGTAAVLSQSLLETGIPLPPVARYPMFRPGISLTGYCSQLAPLFQRIGAQDLAWWGWPLSRRAFIAADWRYQRALDDPIIQEIIGQLVGQAVQVQVTVHTAQPVSAVVTQILESLAGRAFFLPE
jgi:hypothetical protein